MGDGMVTIFTTICGSLTLICSHGCSREQLDLRHRRGLWTTTSRVCLFYELILDMHDRYGHSLSLTTDGRLFVFGGCNVDKDTGVPNYNSNVHVLDTETMIWARPRINGLTPTGRYGHSATTLDNGQIVIFGGWGAGGCQSQEVIKVRSIHPTI